MLRWLRSGAVWAAILGVGCGEPDHPPPPAEDEADPASVFCEALCAAYDRCAPVISLSACLDGCMQEADGLRTYRTELMRTEAACMQKEPCDQVMYDEYWTESCYETAREAIAPTAETYAHCESIAASSFECGWWFSVDDCADAYRVFRSEVLGDIEACFGGSSCAAIDPCVELALSGGAST